MSTAQSPASMEAIQAASPNAPKVKFTGSDRFIRELRKRVDAYFETSGRSKGDVPAMYFKTATILAWFFGAYLLLMFAVHAWWLIIPLAIVLGLAMAAIGFNIQHDAGHRAYSQHQRINKIMSLSLDMIGGSSYLWDWKHNTIHHTYPNVNGQDDDINVGALARLTPDQPHFWYHRAQGVYLWMLYGFLTIKWHLFDDFYNVAIAKIGGHKIPRPKGKNLAIFILGKVAFFSLAFIIPMIFHKVWVVLAIYVLAAFVCGVTLSVVFQLAHCLGEADFPITTATGPGTASLPTDWAVHQVQTTVDFARGNRFISWFVGGLNFQIEHHLFHKISHIHYPALSKVVEETCREFGVRYTAHKSIFAALVSHAKWLVVMGRPGIPASHM